MRRTKAPTSRLPDANRSKRGEASRRQILAGLASLGVAGISANAGRAGAEPPFKVKEWLLRLSMKPIEIPLDYLGLHSDHGVSRIVAAPTYPYDAIHSHDVDNGRGGPATQWANIEIRPGVYYWRNTDNWMNANPDKTLIWVLFGCPKFYQKYPNEPSPYPSLSGGGSPPRDPTTAANFVSALLARYPGRIQFLEIWNEPDFGPGIDPHRDRWTPDLEPPRIFHWHSNRSGGIGAGRAWRFAA